VLNLIKIFTVFGSAYVLFVIFSSNRGYVLNLAVVLTFLLIFDSLTVFFNMIQYIAREVTSIMDIRSIYSHKNILASAIFVKIPFALYLMFFANGWRQRVGYAAGLSAVMAILMLSTRAFYLGFVLLLLALLLFAITRHFVLKKRGTLSKVLRWAGLFILAVLLYSVAQRFLFPRNTDTIWNTGIVSRLSSIRADESSTNARLNSWKRSVRLIREHPVMGVGTGNWKIVVLKYENPVAEDYLYMYKNHNDYLEITAETGIPGGLTFLALLLLVFVAFIKESLKAGSDEERLKLLFLPAFGILAYSVDAFFNFPADRPEIQTLFAIYIALAAAYSGTVIINPAEGGRITALSLRLQKPLPKKLLAAGVWVLLLISAYVLYLNVISLHYQRVREESRNAKTMLPASFFIDGFPAIPSVNCYGEPIVVLNAECLIIEKRYGEAKNMLLADASSPYDGRREYNLALVYKETGMTDSAIYWGEQVYRKKPLLGKIVVPLSSWLFNSGRQQEAMTLDQNYLKRVKTNESAWKLASKHLWQSGLYEKSLATLDSAQKYLPKEKSAIEIQRNVLVNMLREGKLPKAPENKP